MMEADAIQPIPSVSLSKVVGLLEFLDDRGGRQDIYRLAEETHYEFGEMLAVIKMAEMLNLAETPGGDVLLTPLGKKLIGSKIQQRKALIREQLQKLPLFARLVQRLEGAEGRALDRSDVVDLFAAELPNENAETLVKAVINWGRYGELLGYNHDTGKIFLDEG